MSVATLVKAPGQTVTRPMTFSGVITVTALGAIQIVNRGLVVGSLALVVIPTLFNGGVTLAISGGTEGEQYLVRANATDAGGTPATEEVEIVITDPVWTMADGSPGYFGIDRMIDRFGLAEVVRMTDANGSGRIDRAYLVSALRDAQAIVEAHLGGRYALPLDPVPAIVLTWLADLACARLYPGGAPEGAADAAKAATRMLERVQSGVMPLAGVAVPVQAGGDTPVLIAGGTRFYPDGLKGF
jgi:phage gp36-like protein